MRLDRGNARVHVRSATNEVREMRKCIACLTVSFLLVLALAPQCRAQSPRVPVAESGEQEASSGFDSEDVEPVLLRVSSLVKSGFSPAQAKELATRIVRTPVGSEMSAAYEVTVGTTRARIRIVAIMRDYAAPDVYFFSIPALAQAIDGQITAYMASVKK